MNHRILIYNILAQVIVSAPSDSEQYGRLYEESSLNADIHHGEGQLGQVKSVKKCTQQIFVL